MLASVLGCSESRIDMLQGSNLAGSLGLTRSIDLESDIAMVSEMAAEPGRRGSAVAQLCDDLVGILENLADGRGVEVLGRVPWIGFPPRA